MANVQMYCNEMIIAGIRLPPATQITEVQKIQPDNYIMTINVTIACPEQDDESI